MERNKLLSLKPAFIIAGIYFIIGISWIYLSDRVQSKLLISPEQQVLFQTFKGWFYVIITTILLLSLIIRHIHKTSQLIGLLTSDNILLNKILNKNIGFTILLTDKQGNVILTKGETLLVNIKSTQDFKKQEIKNIENFSSETINIFFRNLWQIKQSALQEMQISGKWYEIHGSIFIDEAGLTELALIVFKDITTNKIYEREISEERALNNSVQKETEQWKNSYESLNEKLKLITENLYNGIILTTVDTLGQPANIIEVNKETQNILNLKSEDINLPKLKELLKFKTNIEGDTLFKNNYHLNRQIVIELKLPQKGHQPKTIEIIGRYLNSANQTFVLFIIKDLSNYKYSTSDKNYLDYSNLLNYVNIGIMLFQHDRKCFYLNKTMKDILGIELPNKKVLSTEELVLLGQDIQMEEYLERCIEGSMIHVPSYQLKKLNGKWYESYFIPVKNKEDKKTTYIIRLVKDITPLIEFDQEIKELKRNLEESSMLKNIFLSNLSHEIRTPMNGISGFLDLLSTEKLNRTQKEYLRYIQQSSESLFNMLNSIIELSQLENKSISVNKKWFKISHLLNEIELFGRHNLLIKDNKRVIVKYKTVGEIEQEQIYSDEFKILSISKNILNNAIKYTNKGIIDVSIEITQEECIEIIIKDTGSGIKSSNLNSIFFPFATFNSNDEVVYGGLGLGLSIAKKYVELLGGSILVKSTEGKGSEFIVKTPIGISNIITPEKKEGLVFKKILVIQYSYEELQVIQNQFKQLGSEVVFSPTGTEALEKILNEPEINLIITDIHLTDMESVELLTALRRMHSKIPVIAQTSYFIKEEYDQYIKAGFEDYISKPLKTSQIFHMVIGGDLNHSN